MDDYDGECSKCGVTLSDVHDLMRIAQERKEAYGKEVGKVHHLENVIERALAELSFSFSPKRPMEALDKIMNAIDILKDEEVDE